MILRRSPRGLAFAAALALALLRPVPAAAQQSFSPAEIALPEEQPVAAELGRMMLERPEDPATALDRLDALLSRLGRPTRLRGMVQFVRATAFVALDQQGNAREAIEESIRLLPGYASPLLVAYSLEVYADRPAPAADYLLRAAEADPQTARRMPDYEVNGLVIRLAQQGERRRLQRVAERLFEIGWIGERITLRSRLARELIEGKLEAGDLDAARRLLPRLLAPADARRLLAQRRHRTIWPDVERWAGPRQENLWPAYLNEVRQKWRASRSSENAEPYAQALETALHYETMAREFLPVFRGQLDEAADYDLLWLSSRLAEALARLGRWEEADEVFARGLAVWPLGRDANALNVAANRARLRLARGDATAALIGIDAAIADSLRWEGQVSAGALASMHWVRACALAELHREAEVASSLASVVAGRSATTSAATYVCLGRHEAARDILIAALDEEGQRDDVIMFVQPRAAPPMQSGYGRRIDARLDALRGDAALLEAVSRHGRVLAYPASAGAPPEEGAPPGAQ